MRANSFSIRSFEKYFKEKVWVREIFNYRMKLTHPFVLNSGEKLFLSLNFLLIQLDQQSLKPKTEKQNILLYLGAFDRSSLMPDSSFS